MGKKKDDGSRMGKDCGYTILPNGDIEVAPRYTNEMEEIFLQEDAIKTIMNMFTTSMVGLQRMISERKSDWWKKVTDDYSIDRSGNHYFHNGVIKIKKDEE